MNRLRLLIFCLIFLPSCTSQENGNNTTPSVKVVTQTIEPKTIPAKYSFVGFTHSSHEVEIRARVEGYLEKVVFTEGSFVKAGETLYELDKKPFEAALEKAKGSLAKQEAILWNATEVKKRLEPLFEQNAASKKDLDTAISDELKAQAEVQSAKAELMEAELNLGYTTIKTPISGLSADTNYYEGALITPSSSELLTTISVIDPIYVYFSISENERLKFKKEESNNQIIFPKDKRLQIELVLADDSTYPYKGEVNFSSPTIDQQTGTLSIRASLPNNEETLIPGQFVRIHVIGVLRPNAIVVSQTAVLEGKNGMFVYVVVNKKAEVRNIEVGDFDGNNWIVKSGLIAGDVVITEGVNKVKPGSLVTIMEN